MFENLTISIGDVLTFNQDYYSLDYPDQLRRTHEYFVISQGTKVLVEYIEYKGFDRSIDSIRQCKIRPAEDLKAIRVAGGYYTSVTIDNLQYVASKEY